MKLFDCEQYSPEWWALRRGVATASNFSRIITPKTAMIAAGHRDYLCELIGEALQLDYPGDRPQSAAMLHGSATEPEARRYYEFQTGLDVRQVGFALSDCGRYGCSPDGLVGDDGLLELKCPQPKTHVAYLLDGGLPDEYRAQVHGQLLVTERDWCDFVSYCPGFPAVVVRVKPDEFTSKLGSVLREFLDRLAEAKEKIVGERRAA